MINKFLKFSFQVFVDFFLLVKFNSRLIVVWLLLPSTNWNKNDASKKIIKNFILWKNSNSFTKNWAYRNLPKIHFIPQGDNETLEVILYTDMMWHPHSKLYWHKKCFILYFSIISKIMIGKWFRILIRCLFISYSIHCIQDTCLLDYDNWGKFDGCQISSIIKGHCKPHGHFQS